MLGSDMNEGWELFRQMGVLADSYRMQKTPRGRFIGWWLKMARRMTRSDLRP